jgi:hypothetical protein
VNCAVYCDVLVAPMCWTCSVCYSIAEGAACAVRDVLAGIVRSLMSWTEVSVLPPCGGALCASAIAEWPDT